MVLEFQEAVLTKKKEKRMLVNILEKEILSQIQNSPFSMVPKVQGAIPTKKKEDLL